MAGRTTIKKLELDSVMSVKSADMNCETNAQSNESPPKEERNSSSQVAPNDAQYHDTLGRHFILSAPCLYVFDHEGAKARVSWTIVEKLTWKKSAKKLVIVTRIGRNITFYAKDQAELEQVLQELSFRVRRAKKHKKNSTAEAELNDRDLIPLELSNPTTHSDPAPVSKVAEQRNIKPSVSGTKPRPIEVVPAKLASCESNNELEAPEPVTDMPARPNARSEEESANTDLSRGMACCCCDMRRAVIIINAIFLGLSVVSFFLPTYVTEDDVSSRQEAILDEYYEQTLVPNVISCFIYVLSIIGAAFFQAHVLVFCAFWDLVEYALFVYLDTKYMDEASIDSEDSLERGPLVYLVVFVVFLIFLVFPKAVLAIEIYVGTMSKETYRRVEYCGEPYCFCVF